MHEGPSPKRADLIDYIQCSRRSHCADGGDIEETTQNLNNGSMETLHEQNEVLHCIIGNTYSETSAMQVGKITCVTVMVLKSIVGAV